MGASSRRSGPVDAEQARLDEDAARTHNWKRWGPYLAERQWGTVREDYSPDGSCWTSFPFEHAASRVYRWGEDGLLGICDRECRLCFALTLWNGRDAMLKERLFGLTNPEGNHGEDCKECYHYLDSTPTHSYMRGLYKYPQGAFPYELLRTQNAHRTQLEPEFELGDSGAFADNRYFDVQVEYAKAAPDDLLIRITVTNRGSHAARLHALPTLWFRNTWSWGRTGEAYPPKPVIRALGATAVAAEHSTLGRFRLVASDAQVAGGSTRKAAGGRSTRNTGAIRAEWLFTDNETNARRVWNLDGGPAHAKDAFHEAIIGGNRSALRDDGQGTKCAAAYALELAAGQSVELRLRLHADDATGDRPLNEPFEATFEDRLREADAYYKRRRPPGLSDEQARVHRQACAGLLWSKQFYHYIMEHWLEGDPGHPAPPPQRRQGRNADWPQLFNRDVISMPDKWEYPWYAAWDLAFHMIPFARLDPHFAKSQLLLFLREWYMHPSGQLPAYEFNFSDVNPPVHAWACWRVYKMTGKRGERDREFLARAFQKLLINFTWWVNRKDVQGKHIFAGGFLGLDNIGVFDRSRPLPTGGHLEQADGTAWMAFYGATMLAMALELASEDPTYEDVASKFFEHFVHIADAMNTLGGYGLWDEQDGFYYDQLHVDGQSTPLRIRSMVGLIPLFAVEILEEDVIQKLPGFHKRMKWFLDNRQDLARHIAYMEEAHNSGSHYLLAIPSRHRLERVLAYLLDEREFLSPFGVRSLSRVHESHPYILHAGNETFRVDYVPGESTTGLFGGNSNWRGPIWFPVNYLLIESLERYHHFYGDSLRVECPRGSGRMINLREVARELRRRLVAVFLPDKHGRRPCHGYDPRYTSDPHWRDLLLFHEYFHGETGRGLGANHQTGWTALVASCLEDLNDS